MKNVANVFTQRRDRRYDDFINIQRYIVLHQKQIHLFGMKITSDTLNDDFVHKIAFPKQENFQHENP